MSYQFFRWDLIGAYGGGTLLGQKILVADDEPNIVQFPAFVFNREGFM